MALQWRQGSTLGHFVADCGEEGQGIVRVTRYGEDWHWSVDMLPGDSEPIIHGARPFLTAAAAMAQAQEQVTAWPSLIDGAKRI